MDELPSTVVEPHTSSYPEDSSTAMPESTTTMPLRFEVPARLQSIAPVATSKAIMTGYVEGTAIKFMYAVPVDAFAANKAAAPESPSCLPPKTAIEMSSVSILHLVAPVSARIHATLPAASTAIIHPSFVARCCIAVISPDWLKR